MRRAALPLLNLGIVLAWLVLAPFHANFIQQAPGADSVLNVRILLALAMLVLASAIDVKSRTVSDKVWMAFGVAGVALYALDLPTAGEAAMIVISAAFSVGAAFAMYRLGLFGGADALAIITLAAILPTFAGSNTLHPMAPLTVLTNAALITLVQVPINVGRNIHYRMTQKKRLFEGFEGEGSSKKILAFLVGYRAVKPSRYAFSIEKTANNSRAFDFSLKHAETEEFCDRPHVWVTSALPFLLYMAAGAFVMILVGDLLNLLFLRYV